MGLLDLVEQHHRVGVPLDLLGQLPPFFVPHVAGRRPDQLRDRVLLHVFRHVETDEGRVATEQEVGQRPRQLGLAHAGRAEEHEAAHRAVRRLEAGAGPAYRARQGRGGVLLADDPPVELALHLQQPVALVLVYRRQRHAGPGGHHAVDVLLADLDRGRADPLVEALAHVLEVLAGDDLLLLEELGLLVVLLRRRALHLLDRHPDVAVDVAELLAVAGLAELGARPRLVQQVDRLVGQEPFRDVAARLVDGGLEGFRRVGDVVERLVAVLHPQQHFEGVGLAGRLHPHRLEPPFERAVLLDVPPVLGRGGGADAADLAARQRRLEDVGGVERAFRRTGPDQRVQLVDEQDDVRVLDQLLHDRLEPFLELPPVLGAGHDQGDVEGEDPLVGQEMRHLAADDALGKPLDDGRLPHPRLADQDRVVLVAAAQHLLHPLELERAPDQRVEPVLHRALGEVAAELREQRRLLDPREGGLLVQELHDVLAHGVQAHALLDEDGRGDAALFPEDAEQQVFGPHVVVQQPVGFFGRELQDALGLGAEGDLHRGRHLLAEDRPPLDVLADAFEGQVRAGEDAARQPLAFPDQPQQQVLRLDRDAPELARLVAREEQDPACPLGVALEHRLTPDSPCGIGGGAPPRDVGEAAREGDSPIIGQAPAARPRSAALRPGAGARFRAAARGRRPPRAAGCGWR